MSSDISSNGDANSFSNSVFSESRSFEDIMQGVAFGQSKTEGESRNKKSGGRHRKGRGGNVKYDFSSKARTYQPTNTPAPISTPETQPAGGYQIYVLDEMNMTIVGGQLDGVTQGDGSHLVGLKLTIDQNVWNPISISDNDLNFQDNDGLQRLNGDQSIDGVTYQNGTEVEAEYSFEVTDGTSNWTMVAFNVRNSNPAFATVEGVAVVGGPGGFPPAGTKLTVLSAAEFPSFAASEYVIPEVTALPVEPVESGGPMTDRMLENIDVPSDEELVGMSMKDRMLQNIEVPSEADLAGMSLYDRMLENIKVPTRDDMAGVELIDRMLENIDVPYGDDLIGVDLVDRMVENIELSNDSAGTSEPTESIAVEVAETGEVKLVPASAAETAPAAETASAAETAPAAETASAAETAPAAETASAAETAPAAELTGGTEPVPDELATTPSGPIIPDSATA